MGRSAWINPIGLFHALARLTVMGRLPRLRETHERGISTD
jgi:hypothetical protein